jgi:hypothetical protein
MVVQVPWVTGRGPLPWTRPHHDEVIGTVRLVSDVASVGDSWDRGGAVLAVPAAGMAAFWDAQGHRAAPADASLPQVTTTVSADVVRTTGGVIGQVGWGGRFSLRPVSSGPLSTLSPVGHQPEPAGGGVVWPVDGIAVSRRRTEG